MIGQRHLATQAELLKLLDYDPTSGSLTWLPRTPDMFTPRIQTPEHACKRWNASWAWKPAFTNKTPAGHLRGMIDGKKMQAHVAIWIMCTGVTPMGDIDHINGDPADNRITNLRDVPHAINLRNAKRWSHNKSGHNGVFWNSRYGKWEAGAKVNKRKRYLGTFHRIEDAIAARQRFDAENGFSARHGK